MPATDDPIAAVVTPAGVEATAAAEPLPAKPLLRGWLHLVCFFLAIPAGVLVIALLIMRITASETPSAVLRKMLPVKPSVTTTSTTPLNRSRPSTSSTPIALGAAQCSSPVTISPSWQRPATAVCYLLPTVGTCSTLEGGNAGRKRRP